VDNLSATLERVHFGGYSPPAEEIDQVFRQMEKKPKRLSQAKRIKSLSTGSILKAETAGKN